MCIVCQPEEPEEEKIEICSTTRLLWRINLVLKILIINETNISDSGKSRNESCGCRLEFVGKKYEFKEEINCDEIQQNQPSVSLNFF